MGWWRLGRPGVAVILRLVAEGRLALSDTLERRLPGILPTATRSVSASCSITPAGWPTTRPPSKRRCTRPAGTPPRLDPTGADRPGGRPLIVEAVTGNPLDKELDHCILGPLGLRGTWLPTHDPRIPSPASRGYSLPRRPSGDTLDGPLLDITVQDPSHAWAAGGLLPPGLLAEMRTTVAVPHRFHPTPPV